MQYSRISNPANCFNRVFLRFKICAMQALSSETPMTKATFHQAMLSWYNNHARVLPWRFKSGGVIDPYKVWLSEVMLQQTTVAVVGPYFEDFIRRWPRVQDLANAPLEEVLNAWAGLGYYSRARNLHACAQILTKEHQGVFPSTEAELRVLPGVGPYTAAAIAAIAFDQPAVVVDGNVERVMTRLHASPVPMAANKSAIRAWAADLTPTRHAGDYAQALMDLGATICKSTKPLCLLCPVQVHCCANQQGVANQLPTKRPKTAKPTRYGYAYFIRDTQGAILMDKRPPTGLLGGMDGLPTSPWTHDWPDFIADSQSLNLTVKHTFTHFHLQLSLREAPTQAACAFPKARFVVDYSCLALPTLFKKALKTLNQFP